MQNAWKVAGIPAEQKPTQGIGKETDDSLKNVSGY
jgi:hypothetical protein